MTKRDVPVSRPRRARGAKRSSPVVEDLALLKLGLDEAEGGEQPCYLLRLYVTGTTMGAVRAIERVRAICEQHLLGRYELEIIDIYQLPALARDHQIIATPTLVKVLPLPLRRFIGDFSKSEKVLFGLDLRERP